MCPCGQLGGEAPCPAPLLGGPGAVGLSPPGMAAASCPRGWRRLGFPVAELLMARLDAEGRIRPSGLHADMQGCSRGPRCQGGGLGCMGTRCCGSMECAGGAAVACRTTVPLKGLPARAEDAFPCSSRSGAVPRGLRLPAAAVAVND